MSRTRTLPNGENATLEELDVARKCAAHQRSGDRVFAIKTLIMGIDFGDVARLFDVDEKTLARWVKHFNEFGIDGLIEKDRTGRPPRIDRQKAGDLVEALEHPQSGGQAHWTGKKYHGYIQEKLAIELGYTTVNRTTPRRTKFAGEKDYRALSGHDSGHLNLGSRASRSPQALESRTSSAILDRCFR